MCASFAAISFAHNLLMHIYLLEIVRSKGFMVRYLTCLATQAFATSPDKSLYYVFLHSGFYT